MGFSNELEDNLRRQYIENKQIGEKSLQNGDYKTSEVAFYKAGNAAAKISKMAGEKSKQKWIAISNNYLNASDELKNGKIPSTKKEMKPHENLSIESNTMEEIDSENEFEKMIENDFITTTTISWDQIAGLTKVKDTIKESVVLSVISNRPDAIKPWKGMLLYGPPGTGKTLLAAATAGSLQATFFNVGIGQLLSKYFGESSKLITALYEVARRHAPSIVFLDEFDSIALSRSGEVSEASRRILSTLLSELDGLQNKDTNNYVLTIAATNVPWDLDAAVLSRFPKRVYIPLPDDEATTEIIKIHTIKKGLEFEGDMRSIAEKCIEKIYAGRDISTLCNDAVWNMVKEQNPDLSSLADRSLSAIKDYHLNTRKLHLTDFEKSFQNIESAVKFDDLKQFEEWSKKYGST